MHDQPLSFEGLLGRAPSVPSNLDKHGRPYVRRTTDGHVIAITDPLRPFPPLSWIVVYAGCLAGCDGGSGPGSHRPDLKPGDRLGDQHVGAWPFLNQWGGSEDWVLQHIDGLQRAVKAHQRTYGEQSAKIGALRAELARARERIRELEAAPTGEDLPVYVRDLPRALAERVDGGQALGDITAHLARMAAGYAALAQAEPVPVAPERFLSGCREVAGSWIHGRGRDGEHTCPRWAR